MSRSVFWLFGLVGVLLSFNVLAQESTYQFTLPSKVQITIVEAPFKTRPSRACPSAKPSSAADYQPSTYVKSIRAKYSGLTLDFEVTCMTDAWNGRALASPGGTRYFGGWCERIARTILCSFRGVFADASETYVAEWGVLNSSRAKRSVFTGSSDVVDLFIENIDPPRY